MPNERRVEAPAPWAWFRPALPWLVLLPCLTVIFFVYCDPNYWECRANSYLPQITNSHSHRSECHWNPLVLRVSKSGGISFEDGQQVPSQTVGRLLSKTAEEGGCVWPLEIRADAATRWGSVQELLRTARDSKYYKAGIAFRDEDCVRNHVSVCVLPAPTNAYVFVRIDAGTWRINDFVVGSDNCQAFLYRLAAADQPVLMEISTNATMQEAMEVLTTCGRHMNYPCVFKE